MRAVRINWLSVSFHELMARSLYIKSHYNDHPAIKTSLDSPPEKAQKALLAGCSMQ